MNMGITSGGLGGPYVVSEIKLGQPHVRQASYQLYYHTNPQISISL